jgi:hypothetical protein
VPGDAVARRLADRDGLVVALPGQHERELLPAEARAEGARGQAGAEHDDQPLQHAVAEQVPVGVVHLLEVVDVHQRDRQAGGPHRGVVRLVEQGRQALVEVAAVVGGGEAVAAAQLPRLGVLAAQPVELVARPLVALQEADRRAEVVVGLLPAAQPGEPLAATVWTAARPRPAVSSPPASSRAASWSATGSAVGSRSK